MSACSSSPAASDDETDDEMPTSSVAELTIAPDEQPGETNAAADATNSNVVPNTNTSSAVQDEEQQRRSKTHSNLCAYELKRRTAYESKLLSSSLYWHAFRTLLHDSLLETQKADMLVRGWTHASKQYGVSMASVGEWCIDDKGAPVVDVKKKKKLFEQAAAAAAAQTANNNDVGGGATAGGLAGGSEGGGVSVSVGSSSMLLFPAQQQRKGSTAQRAAAAEFYREERCGSMIKTLAESAGTVAGRFEEMTGYMYDEVLPELASLSDHLKSEVMFMEKLGDSIMNELEAAEEEVCKSWKLYYNATVSSNDTTSAECTNHQPPNPPDASLPIINTPSKDVWVSEMRYRMAVAFLSSVWEKCSSELSKLFLSMKDAECRRRKRMKEILLRAAQRQEHLWLGLPSVINPFLKELTEWPMERRAVEEDVQSSIRDRAQAIQIDEMEHKKPEGDSKPQPGLGGEHSSGDGDFELSSPLVSDLMIKAKVVEKRTPGLMASWKVSLAVVTSDAHLQLFELPPGSKLHTGSAPEVAFQNLIPPVVVPSMEGVVKGGGAKFPSSKYWFDHLVPSESFALSNCVVALNGDDKDGKAANSFEVVETILTSGASKMFTKTMNRKMQFRAITRDEAKDFVAALKDSV